MKFREELFTRRAADGRRIIYVRFIDTSSKRVILTKSTQTTKKTEARAFINQILASGALEQAFQDKCTEDRQELDEDKRLRALDIGSFARLFWSADSPYLSAKKDSGASLSAVYVANSGRAVELYVSPWPPFKSTKLHEASLLLLERFVRESRAAGKNPGQVKRALDALQTPLAWAMKRNLIDRPFTFSAIDRPKLSHKKRGILTREEVLAIIALPTVDETQPRPRIKKGGTQAPPANLDKRIKTAILLSFLAGMRRGEIRALRWRDIDLDQNIITITSNFTRDDGHKAPKAKSTGVVPIPDALRAALLELKAYCLRIGRATTNDYVIPNEDRDKPVAEITLARGFARALAAIGIEDDMEAAKEG